MAEIGADDELERQVNAIVDGIIDGPAENDVAQERVRQINVPDEDPSMTEILSRINSQLDRAYRQNESLDRLVRAQKEQLDQNNARVDLLSAELQQAKEVIKKKDLEDKSTAIQVLLQLEKVFPDWIRKDSQDKTRGFASSKAPSPKMIIPLDVENSWLADPTPIAPDTIGSFPQETKFPSADRDFVPKEENQIEGSSRNWPNVIPFEFEDSKIHSFITANSLSQNGKIQLDAEIFNPGSVHIDPKEENFHVLDVLSRKSLVEISIVDHILAQGKKRFQDKVKEATQDPPSFDSTDWQVELNLYLHLFEVAYASNLRARQTATAFFVTNKRKGRNLVLDKFSGSEFTKNILRGTSFASSLFGKIPESHRSRIRDSVSNRDANFTLSLKKNFSQNTSFKSTNGKPQASLKRDSSYYPQPPKKPYYSNVSSLPSTSSSPQPFRPSQGSYPSSYNNSSNSAKGYPSQQASRNHKSSGGKPNYRK